jgi:polyhydroxybutyrate depolymerase
MIRALIPLCAAFLLLAVACSGDDDGTSDLTPLSTSVETPQTAGCSPARAATPGDTNATITSDGVERSYILHVPASYGGTSATPIVFVFHGFAFNADFIKGYTLFGDLGEEENFITVFPNGLGEPPRWNDGGDVTVADDIQYFRDLLTYLEEELCLDPDRIFLAGYSNGGGMAQRIACALPERIAAFGTVAATYVDCKAPVPWLAVHGIDDLLVPFEGGFNPPERGGGAFLPARRVVSEWARELGCDGLGLISRPASEVELTTFARCAKGDGEALLYSIIRGGHTWPGAYDLPTATVGFTSKQLDATKTMWDFFVSHPLAQ